MNNESKIFTISELTKNIRTILEESFYDIWVEGEISNYKLHTSGHMYFTLKDENASTIPSAQLKVAMFRNANQNLKFELQDGLKVICNGTISVYDKRGDYQLIVNYIEPAGLGALQLAYEQLKQKLEKEGLFDEAHKKPIPEFPESIGIITSPTGAAIRDILKIINRRYPNVRITIYPVKVQGEGAKEEISLAIKEMNEIEEFDVLIIGRGGGSIEDLWSFNEEIVARAIYISMIPIISAVGHEIDYTISDFVADKRASTPSSAAELVVPDRIELIKNINSIKNRLYLAIKNIINSLREKIIWIKKKEVFKNPIERIRQFGQDIDEISDRISIAIRYVLEINKKNLGIITGKLSVLNPLSILERGYSVCFKLPDKKIIKDTKDVIENDEINIKLHKGEIFAIVK